MRAYYSDSFVLPLPPGHRFPMEKYARLRSRVAAELPAGAVQLEQAPAASDAEILRAHDAAWLQAVVAGTLTPRQQRDIGFPWSPQMVERSRRSSGATVAACRAALATLQIFKDDDVLAQNRVRSAAMAEALSPLAQHPSPA